MAKKQPPLGGFFLSDKSGTVECSSLRLNKVGKVVDFAHVLVMPRIIWEGRVLLRVQEIFYV